MSFQIECDYRPFDFVDWVAIDIIQGGNFVRISQREALGSDFQSEEEFFTWSSSFIIGDKTPPSCQFWIIFYGRNDFFEQGWARNWNFCWRHLAINLANFFKIHLRFVVSWKQQECICELKCGCLSIPKVSEISELSLERTICVGK